MSDTKRYPANVFWSEEDEGFIAIASDLPGCSAFGDTQEEALAELQHAIGAWVAAAKDAGNAVPRPSKPVGNEEFSGKLHLRMPRSLHAGLSAAAKREDVSLNQYVVFILAASQGSLRHDEPESRTVFSSISSPAGMWVSTTNSTFPAWETSSKPTLDLMLLKSNQPIVVSHAPRRHPRGHHHG